MELKWWINERRTVIKEIITVKRIIRRKKISFRIRKENQTLIIRIRTSNY